MAAASVPEADFIKLFEELGPNELARRLNVNVTSVFKRRKFLERKLQRQITGPDHENNTRHGVKHSARKAIEVTNGIVLIGSDGHYWPGEPSTAHRAFVKFAKNMRPAAVIMNGDVLDCATVSRHAPIGWEHRPTLIDEIEVSQERLHEIEMALPRGCKKIWNLGNHDGRFETRLATVAPEYARVHGVHLQDHFPHWEPAWACWINDTVVVKHRFKGGMHAPWNNTLWAGKTVCTGHLHSAKIIPYTDYNGTRYGIDTGCLADPDAAAFVDYTEDSPKNWRSGFCVLTFKDGELLMPELVLVWDEDHVQFRGELVKV